MKKYIFATLIVVGTLITGCGEGGGSSSNDWDGGYVAGTEIPDVNGRYRVISTIGTVTCNNSEAQEALYSFNGQKDYSEQVIITDGKTFEFHTVVGGENIYDKPDSVSAKYYQLLYPDGSFERNRDSVIKDASYSGSATISEEGQFKTVGFTSKGIVKMTIFASGQTANCDMPFEREGTKISDSIEY